MGVSTSHREQDIANADWSRPPSLTSYRLFSGGPEYQVPTLPRTLENETLANSVTDNPLGLYFASDHLTIGDNVTLRGTVICRKEIRIDGTNIRLEPVDIPPLNGESLDIQLPVAVCWSFEVQPGASCAVKGLVSAFDHLEVDKSSSRGQLQIAGKVIAGDLDILEDTDWDALDWWDEFHDYLNVNGPNWIYFPLWMRFMGYHYAPTVHIKQGEDVQYHWYRPGEPIFIPHADDFSEMDADEEPGLRWELIEIVPRGRLGIVGRCLRNRSWRTITTEREGCRGIAKPFREEIFAVAFGIPRLNGAVVSILSPFRQPSAGGPPCQALPLPNRKRSSYMGIRRRPQGVLIVPLFARRLPCCLALAGSLQSLPSSYAVAC